jgi:hypothetical protein
MLHPPRSDALPNRSMPNNQPWAGPPGRRIASYECGFVSVSMNNMAADSYAISSVLLKLSRQQTSACSAFSKPAAITAKFDTNKRSDSKNKNAPRSHEIPAPEKTPRYRRTNHLIERTALCLIKSLYASHPKTVLSSVAHGKPGEGFNLPLLPKNCVSKPASNVPFPNVLMGHFSSPHPSSA